MKEKFKKCICGKLECDFCPFRLKFCKMYEGEVEGKSLGTIAYNMLDEGILSVQSFHNIMKKLNTEVDTDMVYKKAKNDEVVPEITTKGMYLLVGAIIRQALDDLTNPKASVKDREEARIFFEKSKLFQLTGLNYKKLLENYERSVKGD